MVVKQIKQITSVSFLKGEKNMAVTRAWKINGKDGHSQRESFGENTLLGQLDDGAFENSNTGKEEEITLSELEKLDRSAIITKHMHRTKKKKYICVDKKTRKVLATQISYDTLSARDFIFLVGRNLDELEVITEEI